MNEIENHIRDRRFYYITIIHSSDIDFQFHDIMVPKHFNTSFDTIPLGGILIEDQTPYSIIRKISI